MAYFLSNFLKIKRAALLCLPPFYKNRRILNIRIQSYDFTYPRNNLKRIVKKINLILIWKIKETILKILLSQFHLIIAVSTAIVEEMNEKWEKRIKILNPNTSYRHVKKGEGEEGKEEYKYDALFYARLIPEKGIFDIPIIWRKVVAKIPEAKIAIAGKFQKNEVKSTFFKLINRLSLNKNVIYIGWKTREEIGKLLERSKIVIYPSYLDAIPAVVIESLAYNKLVIAYNIPAIRHNFPIREVIKIEVGNYDEMAEKVIDVLRKGKYRVEVPLKFLEKFKSWDKVVESEIAILKKLL